MKALILYDSFFGNTEKIAQAMAGVLAARAEVRLQKMAVVTDSQPVVETKSVSAVNVKVESINTDVLEGVDVLLLGSPTRAFTSSPATKDFLRKIPAGGLNGVKAAAFDTRMDVVKVNNKFLSFMVKIFGYAAESLSKTLAKKGAQIISEPGRFIVEGSEGPLSAGEVERAEAWTKSLPLS
jgi:flavodoxin